MVCLSVVLGDRPYLFPVVPFVIASAPLGHPIQKSPECPSQSVPILVFCRNLYQVPEVFVMAGLKEATALVAMRSTVFRKPITLGGIMARGYSEEAG